jgi:hypothetical protein
METYIFTVLVNEVELPVECSVDDNGQPQYLKSPQSDDNTLFDNFKDLTIPIRRKDKSGFDREHDARMCASRVNYNGNADFRIEFSDIYVSLHDLCRACGFITLQYENNVPISYKNDGVIAYAISNYI